MNVSLAQLILESELREAERIAALPRLEQIRERIRKQRSLSAGFQIGAPFPASISLSDVEYLLGEVDRLNAVPGPPTTATTGGEGGRVRGACKAAEEAADWCVTHNARWDVNRSVCDATPPTPEREGE